MLFPEQVNYVYTKPEVPLKQLARMVSIANSHSTFPFLISTTNVIVGIMQVNFNVTFHSIPVYYAVRNPAMYLFKEKLLSF